MFLILMREKRDGRLGQFCLSGLFRSSGLSGFSFKILDETRNDSARLVACVTRIIHDDSSEVARDMHDSRGLWEKQDG